MRRGFIKRSKKKINQKTSGRNPGFDRRVEKFAK